MLSLRIFSESDESVCFQNIFAVEMPAILWGLTKPLGAFLGSLSGEVHREISPPSLLCYIDLQVAQEPGGLEISVETLVELMHRYA